MERVSEITSIPILHLDVYPFILRENMTFRPDEAIRRNHDRYVDEDNHSVCFVARREMPAVADATLVDAARPDALIFMKIFDRETKTIEMLGCMLVPVTTVVMDLVPRITEMSTFGSNTLLCCEELKQYECNPIDLGKTLTELEIQTGDILVWEVADASAEPAAPEHYLWLKHNMDVEFRDLNNPDDEESKFTLELDDRDSYDTVVAKLAAHLRYPDPRRIQLTSTK